MTVTLTHKNDGLAMHKAALVSIELAKGSDILRMFDEAGLDVKVALWAYLSEYEDWRFIVASRKFDEVGLFDAYGLIRKALKKGGLTVAQFPIVMILSMKDPFIKSLRQSYGKTNSVQGIRVGYRLFGDRFVEDGLMYRVS